MSTPTLSTSPPSASDLGENARLSSEKPPALPFTQRHRKAIILASVAVILLLVGAILLGVLLPRFLAKNSGSGPSSNDSSTNSSSNFPSVPPSEPTNATYILSLFNNTSYDNTARANPNVPPLTESFPYGSQPIRGVNLGGWLVLEPFITPSIFDPYNPNPYNASQGIIDEWTISAYLGTTAARSLLDNHYATWVTEKDIRRIADVGLDHIRIPIAYWAIDVQKDEPYIPHLSLFYFLRVLEWARKYGLRVNVDMHALPGSQNGWNHSGRSGIIGWLNGTLGSYNAYNRSLPIIAQVAKIVSQPRYRNVVTMFGLVNEPYMPSLVIDTVLKWEEDAYNVVRGEGFTGVVVISDGFMGLNTWTGKMQPAQGYTDVALDTHFYQIFTRPQLATTHYQKISVDCTDARTSLMASGNRSTGFGPTILGEWSVAETDCTHFLNGVGLGNRFDGTFVDGGAAVCPNCTCKGLNDTTNWTPVYKQFLQAFAQSQIDGYTNSWGWFYWNFKTESEPHWSYFDLVDLGILPQKAYAPTWTCAQNLSSVPVNILQR
ncbi:glycoside hydrolase superfamily [Jimgerdemannia flammicorona]|uniref:glucan 1,3-beta-glucosidase n=1 Tax=Jimgerdemannia flammicorona TaxID=994334 RepID=A0A433QZ58_9FUNG|nr:glycoside hydrolase superfamily [Jimgerdemannia flammicorona]